MEFEEEKTKIQFLFYTLFIFCLFIDWGQQAGKEERPASTSQETQSEDKDCRPADREQPALAAC